MHTSSPSTTPPTSNTPTTPPTTTPSTTTPTTTTPTTTPTPSSYFPTSFSPPTSTPPPTTPFLTTPTTPIPSPTSLTISSYQNLVWLTNDTLRKQLAIIGYVVVDSIVIYLKINKLGIFDNMKWLYFPLHLGIFESKIC